MLETGLTSAPAPPASAAEALRAIPWLAGAAPATLARLAAQALVIRLPRRAQIFDQAELPAFAQLVLAGTVELIAVRGQEEVLIDVVRPLDMLLPAALLGNLPYLVRACVREDATLLIVPAEAFRLAVAADHGLCLAILACQGAQFRRQMKLAKAIRLRSAEERLGAFMLGLALARPGQAAIRLPAEKRQIAAQLGMTRETFSRVLPALAAHGLRIHGDRLEVDDLSAARAAFPFDPLIDGRDEIRPLSPGGKS